MFQRRKIVVLLLICLSFFACVPSSGEWSPYKTKQVRGVYHRIKSGETLWSIGRAYQISVQDIAEINNISDPNLIEVDDVIFIPHANQVIDDVISLARRSGVSVKAGKEGPLLSSKESEGGPREDNSKMTTPISSGDSIPKPVAKDAVSQEISAESNMEDKTDQTVKQIVNREQSIQFDRKRFIWPVKGKVISVFGIQPNGMYYNGIRIAAMERVPVLAAAGGTVIFSAPLKDYGETMIIKHEDNYATVYTNLGCRMRKVNDEVRKGDQIALLGNSEKKGESYLNFEIRHKNKARNPLFFLP